MKMRVVRGAWCEKAVKLRAHPLNTEHETLNTLGGRA